MGIPGLETQQHRVLPLRVALREGDENPHRPISKVLARREARERGSDSPIPKNLEGETQYRPRLSIREREKGKGLTQAIS